MHIACFAKTLIIIVPKREREREALWRQSVVTLQCGDNGNGIREYFIRFFFFQEKSRGHGIGPSSASERERVSYKFINSYEFIQYVYSPNSNTYV